MIKKLNNFWIFFAVFLSIFLFVFRSLFLNFSTNLIDSMDYPYIVWVMSQNINHIKNFDLVNFFNTNAFYPQLNTMFFSDLLLPQSIMGLFFSYFIKNVIILFNTVFLITFCLNYFSVYFFWFGIFRKKIIAFLGSIMIVFSPILITQLGHFQMQCYWPFFFCLYFIFRHDKIKKIKYLVYAVFFLSLQFLSSVYWAVFLLTTISLFYFLKFLINKEKLKVLYHYFFVIIIFGLLNFFFIKGYFEVKNNFKVERSMEEYISLSAHIMDYSFTNYSKSLVNKLNFVRKWNLLNQHLSGEVAMFPGLLIMILFIVGFLNIKKSNKFLEIKLLFDFNKLFFLTLILIGFWFSLGPRIHFNGHYDGIPTGYNFLLEYIPLFESIRAIARWSSLFYIGTIYFVLIALTKYVSKKIFIIFVLFLYFIELAPLNWSSKRINYKNDNYEYLRNICNSEKSVVLEYPITHLDSKGNVQTRLSYISTILLSSTYHGCYLINGYSGVDLNYLRDLEISFSKDIVNGDLQDINDQLKKYQVDFLIINLGNIKSDDEVLKWKNIDLSTVNSKVLINNDL